MNYDLIIIGGGPGGYSCALRAVAYGLRTALIEKDLLGGTCLNRGCIPTKTLLFAAGLLSLMKDGRTYGVDAEDVRPDYDALRGRCASVTGQLRAGLEKLLKQKKIDIYAGTGHITAEGEVTVETADGETVLTAGDIVLATGSVPAVPPIFSSRRSMGKETFRKCSFSGRIWSSKWPGKVMMRSKARDPEI